MILSVTRGDRAVFTLVLNDTSGTPIDLEDHTVMFMAKERLLDTDDDAVISKIEGDGIDISESPDTGEIALILEPEDTEGLVDASRLVWDVQIDDGFGDVQTPLSGTLVIKADVSQGVGASS